MSEKAKQVTVRVPAELFAALGRLAARGDRTVAAEIRRAVKLHVEADK